MHKDPFALRSQRCLSAPKHSDCVPGDPHCGSKYLEHHELVGTSKPMITNQSLQHNLDKQFRIFCSSRIQHPDLTDWSYSTAHMVKLVKGYALLDLKKYPLTVWSPVIEENHLDPLGCPNICILSCPNHKKCESRKAELDVAWPKRHINKTKCLSISWSRDGGHTKQHNLPSFQLLWWRDTVSNLISV